VGALNHASVARGAGAGGRREKRWALRGTLTRREKESFKTCTRCRRRQPVTSFGRNRRSADSLSSWDRACHAARTSEWRATHRETNNARKRANWAKQRGAINARRRELYAARKVMP
jgi:hypothetical protein